MTVEGMACMIAKGKLPIHDQKTHRRGRDHAGAASGREALNFAKGRWTTVREQKKPRTCRGFQ